MPVSYTVKPNIHMEGMMGPGGAASKTLYFSVAWILRSSPTASCRKKPGRPVDGAWHLVGGSCPASELGQARLLKG